MCKGNCVTFCWAGSYINNMKRYITAALVCALFLVVPLSLFFMSCKSSSFALRDSQERKQAAVRNTNAENPDFLGDFDPIRLEDVMALRVVFGKLKPTRIRLYFLPRTNVVEAYLRDGMNAYALLFTQKEREALSDGITLYTRDYQAYAAGDKNAMNVRAPSAKNAYNRGSLTVGWGAASTVRNGKTEFRTNYEFLEKGKPYFVFTAEPADDSEDQDAQSPVLHLYFSPSQLEKLINTVNQDVLQEKVDELSQEAFSF